MPTQALSAVGSDWLRLDAIATIVVGEAYIVEPEVASKLSVVCLAVAITPDVTTEGHTLCGPSQVIVTSEVYVWIRAFPTARSVNVMLTPVVEYAGPGASSDGRVGVTAKALDVILQDPTNPTIDTFFVQPEGTATTLTAPAVVGERTITVASSAGFSAGDYFSVLSNPGQNRIWFGEVASVPNGTSLALNVAIDFEFAAASEVILLERDLAVNGAVTPQVFAIRGFGAATLPLDLDVTRLIFTIVCTAAPLFTSFGDIVDGLDNGILLRIVRPTETRNLWFIQSNADFAGLAYDVGFYDATHPQAVNGVAARLTYAGSAKHGAVLRIEEGDVLELVVYDDLSTLLSFNITVQGHIVI